MIPFSPEVIDRGQGLPTARCLNVFAEPRGEGWRMMKRPGLVQRTTNAGLGPVRGVFRTPNVREDIADESVFILSGNEWFQNQASILAGVPGDDFARFASDRSQVIMLAGGKVFRFKNGAAAAIDVISPEVQDLTILNARTFYIEKGSDIIRYSEFDDAADVEALSFFRAEGMPDSAVGLEAADGELVIFGKQSVEVYTETGSANAPVTGSGRYDVGCASRDSIVTIDGVSIWVGDSKAGRKVYALGNGPAPISTPTIERLIADSETINAYSTAWAGHTFYVLNLSTGTYAFDLASKKWAEWTSHDEGRFRISSAAMLDGEAWLGDYLDGRMWRWGTETYRDNVENIEAVVTAFIPAETAGPCPPLELMSLRGVGRTDSGQADDPIVELRHSDDGRTWSPWKAKRLGAAGEYWWRAVWRMLGAMRRPGRYVEVRSTDAVAFAATGLEAGVP